MNWLYKIEIDPHPSDDIKDKDNPYLWKVLCVNRECLNSIYSVVNAGWAKTPEEAFKEAKRFYDKYKKEN